MTTKRPSTITITNPIDTFSLTINSLKARAIELYDSIMESSRSERIASRNFFATRQIPKFNKKRAIQIAFPVLLIVIFAFVAFGLIKKATAPQVAGVATESGIVTTKIDRKFEFPLTDAKGKKTGSFTYVISTAELRHKIVVKGQNATSVPGRVFLILNLQLINPMSQGLSINTRDYVRISVNGNAKDWFAPDIHNDPVEAQAISTTNTRVGIAINENDNDIKLQIGEINGEKTVIPVTFKK